MRICIVDKKINLVVNIAIMGENLPANVIQPAEPPDGFLWIEDEKAGIGWKFDGVNLIAPPQEPAPSKPVPAPNRTEQLIALLKVKNIISEQDIPQPAQTALLDAANQENG